MFKTLTIKLIKLFSYLNIYIILSVLNLCYLIFGFASNFDIRISKLNLLNGYEEIEILSLIGETSWKKLVIG